MTIYDIIIKDFEIFDEFQGYQNKIEKDIKNILYKIGNDSLNIIFQYLLNIQTSSGNISEKLLSNIKKYINKNKYTNEGNEKYWKDITEKEFGNIMVKSSNKSKFPSWYLYYNYLKYMFDDPYNSHHIISYKSLNCSKGNITPKILEKFLSKRPDTFKEGDFVELQLNDPGKYKKSISYIIENNIDNQCKLSKFKPNNCLILEDFPITYFMPIMNDMYKYLCCSFYPENFGITIKEDNIKEISLHGQNFKYFIFIHHNINYCIEFPIIITKKEFTEIFLQRTILQTPLSEHYTHLLQFLLSEYKITWKQILILQPSY